MEPLKNHHQQSQPEQSPTKQYLDENKSLILKTLDSQNSGKLSECAENQAKLQKNLMYLAAIADSQPEPPTMHPQYSSTGMMQQGAHYMQQQAAGDYGCSSPGEDMHRRMAGGSKQDMWMGEAGALKATPEMGARLFT